MSDSKPAKKFTDPLLRKAFVEAVESLGYIDLACARVNVSRQTYYNLVKSVRDRKAQGLPVKRWETDMLGAVKNARKIAEVKLLGQIDVAANEPKCWQAAAWRLQHINPKRYARRAPAPAPAQDKLTAAKAVRDALDNAEQTANAPIDEDY